MQKSIRYYITKTGEESTVRSVHVALGARDSEALVESAVTPAVLAKPTGHLPAQATKVKRRVKDAIRGRISDR